MTASKKILLVTSEFPPNVGGIGNHAFNLAKALSAEGFDVTVVADIIRVNEFERSAFARIQPFEVKWIIRKTPLRTYLRRIYTALDFAGEVSTVICSGKFSLWIGILLRMFYPSRKLVAIVHGSELDIKSLFPRKTTFYALKKFNHIISVSNFTQNFLPAGLSSTITTSVIHNGVDLSEFGLSSFKSLLPGDPALITIGSVTDRKGQENVIRSLPQILRAFPAAQYHVVGKPVIQPRLMALAEALQVSKSVHFYGAVDREDLLRKLMGATIKLMLSNHTEEGDFEGFGIAVLEANAFGIPVIGSRNSGIADAIRHEKTGLLVDEKNCIEVAAAVEKIINNYSFFSTGAKEWARQHDWKIIVKEYIRTLSL